ncbi:MAG TPA: hypothetical protein VLB76_15340 [Thermoanaerobaculia bacterium]|jgi:hypothetical protein|nr:hypothetical protein [Thermoanaerobaculia bacterium]
MTREDYEEQKRRLAEQHRALLEMVETAHQLQLRALEIVWRMMSGEGTAEALPPPVVPRPAAAAPLSPAPPARRRQKAGELYHDVLAALPGLPDPFTQSDVCGAIGYTPDRGSLYRTLQELRIQGSLAVQSSGSGSQPTSYRRA